MPVAIGNRLVSNFMFNSLNPKSLLFRECNKNIKKENMHSVVKRLIYVISVSIGTLLGAEGVTGQQIDARNSQPDGSIDYWAIESEQARLALPEFKTIPPISPENLTLSKKKFSREDHLTWERSLGDSSSIRYSGLRQINEHNVHRLKPVWIYESGDIQKAREAGIRLRTQGNPLIIDGIIYTGTVGQDFVALNGETGEEIWRFERDKILPKESWTAPRGAVYWKGDEAEKHGRLYFGVGHYVVSLNSSDGTLINGFGENGIVDVFSDARPAGVIYKDNLIISTLRGPIYGIDLKTGNKTWEFDVNPQPGEFGHDTWDKIDHEPGDELRGGVSCWSGMALDEDRGIVYFSTSSPKPNYAGAQNRGRNLFANCVVALDALSGERIWHFQEIRHDIWDMDVGAPPMVVSFDFAGNRIDAVAQVTKMGNTLVLDRVSGKPLYPFDLRRAPTSDVPGEVTWPYQPALLIPEPFIDQEFTIDDITDISPEATLSVKTKIDSGLIKLGWMAPPGINHFSVTNLYGGSNWPGGCFDPETGVLYVSVNHIPTLARVTPASIVLPTKEKWGESLQLFSQSCVACHGESYEGVGVAPGLFGLDMKYSKEDIVNLISNGNGAMPGFKLVLDEGKIGKIASMLYSGLSLKNSVEKREERPRYATDGYRQLQDHEGYPAIKPPWGTLTAIDLKTGKIEFKSVLGEYEELTEKGIPKTGTKNFGGPIVTAGGLVFVAGTKDHKIRAFSKYTGEELWEYKLPYGGYSIPSTYEINGRQYLIIHASGTGHGFISVGERKFGDNIVAFAL